MGGWRLLCCTRMEPAWASHSWAQFESTSDRQVIASPRDRHGKGHAAAGVRHAPFRPAFPKSRLLVCASSRSCRNADLITFPAAHAPSSSPPLRRCRRSVGAAVARRPPRLLSTFLLFETAFRA